MPSYIVTTEERVTGTYRVVAASPDDAMRAINSNPHNEGEQLTYDAYSLDAINAEEEEVNEG